MAMPSSVEARRFYRAAFQRFREAEVLLTAGYTTGSIYLAGYAVECILKALILAATPAGEHVAVLKTFKGGKAHDYEWRRAVYLTRGVASFPRQVNRQFNLINDRSTELRYSPRTARGDEAEAFTQAALGTVLWADGRL